MIKKPVGTQDILPASAAKWNYVESLFRDVCEVFGYGEIRTPVFEYNRLFKRGVGETTDIVQKEMYNLKFKKAEKLEEELKLGRITIEEYQASLKKLEKEEEKESLTLKPEGTAPVIRSFIENKMYADPQPTKVFYITPCFRYERPQAGRLRAFHQFGVEAIGTSSPSVDAEVIAIAMEFFKRVGLDDLELRINNIGTPSSRNNYHKLLKDFLLPNLENLCDTCKDRFERNPMRILDCKNPDCKQYTVDAPLMIDNLDEDSLKHFDSLKKYLTSMDIEYIVDPLIVRGLDYYTNTAFEIISKDIGSQATVCGGGRYDGLVESLDGPSMPGVGFGMGQERLLLTLENKGISVGEEKSPSLFVACLGEEAHEEAFKILKALRSNGIACDKEHGERSLKAQFKYADKLNAKYVLVVGQEEVKSRKAILKNMEESKQEEINLDLAFEELKKRL